MKNEPGEIRGMLNERVEIGKITLNNECGIYGEYDKECDLLNNRKEVFVASKNEIETGPATIYCSIDGDGMPKEYNINVVKKSDLIGIKSKDDNRGDRRRIIAEDRWHNSRNERKSNFTKWKIHWCCNARICK